MNYIGMPENIELNEFNKHVRTIILAYPLIYSDRMEVMRNMFMSQTGSGYSWNSEGIIADSTDLSSAAEAKYREQFFSDIDELVELTGKSPPTSRFFEGTDVYYKLIRAERQFKLVNIDAISSASPPGFDIGISAERVMDSYNRDQWNCLNIPENANPHYRKAALEVIARVIGTLNEHRDTTMYAEIVEVLKEQAQEPSQPKL
jgi:hypothetical protein